MRSRKYCGLHFIHPRRVGGAKTLPASLGVNQCRHLISSAITAWLTGGGVLLITNFREDCHCERTRVGENIRQICGREPLLWPTLISATSLFASL